MFSAYSLDPDLEYGWSATHRLPLDSAIQYSKEFKKRVPEGLVAVVPDHTDPGPILEFFYERALSRKILLI